MADVRGNTLTNALAPSSNDAWRALALDRLGGIFPADLTGLAARAAMAGRLIVASDADQNDALTGQTSFVNTTPTLLLNVPSGSCAIPVAVELVQTGTVGGGAVDVLIEADDIAAFASGGTAETLFYFRNGAGFTTACAVYSGATATAGFGTNLFQATIGQDVSPAEGAVNGVFWRPRVPYILVGPASLKVFTYAATTGPSWFWHVEFIDLPPAMFTN